MLYSFTKQDKLPHLPAIKEMEIRHVDDPLLLSVIGSISLQEATYRLANANKAYVAYFDGIPAAFGWMAMGKARIGELNHEFILPPGHRYLWNFRTLLEFRGLGIYPRLLQGIVFAEVKRSECFWIMHAPENKASESGIRKAGFSFRGHISLINGNEVIINHKGSSRELSDIVESFGFSQSNENQASCWNCSSPYVKNKTAECCCLEDNIACSHQGFYSLAEK
jgi:hypothetical protein